MNKKSILCLLLALVMLLSLAACGMDTKPAEEPQSQEADTPPAHEELPVETPAPTPEAAHEVDPLLQALFLSLPKTIPPAFFPSEAWERSERHVFLALYRHLW